MTIIEDTMQNRAVPPAHNPIPAPPVARPAHPNTPHSKQKPGRKRKARRKTRRSTTLWLLAGGLVFALSACAALALGAVMLFSAGRVPPNVTALGVQLGMKTEQDAAALLQQAASSITLRDENRVWQADAAELGIMLDAQATAARAVDVGFAALFGGVQVQPVVSVNSTDLETALNALAPQVELPARNAGIRLFNGQVQAVPAQNGRVLDVPATVAALSANPALALKSGQFELSMRAVVPAVADASPLVARAERLLASPLRVRGYDPFDDTWAEFSVQPSEWANWLIAEEDPSSELGIKLALNQSDALNFITSQAERTLADYQSIKADEVLAALNAAVSNLQTDATTRIYEGDRTHTVRSGESITSIAWDYGIPYPYIQQANPGVSTLSVGMTLTIPSREVFLEYPIVNDKRVVVSISGNWTKVYENGQLKWDWVSSTGIKDSPTWPGVYQIISHEETAYAGNWNLYMPWFMGVYKPIPGSGFTNGFHGFPTRGGGQLLWENSLGTKVTYGCILLSNTNVKLLYDWAQDGVIVEILP